MTPIYYIQLEDKNSTEGSSINTLAGLKNKFTGPKETIVFTNHAAEIKDKYAQSGIKTTIYQNERYTIANFPAVVNQLKTVFADKEQFLIIFDQTSLGCSLGSRLAALLKTTFVADAQNISAKESIAVEQNIANTKAVRQLALGAKAVITTSFNGHLAKEKVEARVVDWVIDQSTADQYCKEKNADNDLAYAKIVVAGGKGLGSAKQFGPLAKLAQKLNASLGATKAVTDQGWVGAEKMIGISNLLISPDVYYAFGLSGAVQHTVGIKNAKCIIAVNIDQTAPIFKLASYGIVGDANIVIKQLNELL